MKSLADYAKELLFINEGLLNGTKDYYHKGDYKYIKMLFSYLFGETDGLELKICVSSTIPKDRKITAAPNIELTKNNFIDSEKIKKLFNKSVNEIKSVSDIDFGEYSLNDIDKILRQSLNKDTIEQKYYDILYNSKAIIFNRLDKTPFSKGSSPGGNAEIVVCNAFNNNMSDDEIQEYCATKYTDVNTKDWLASIRNTINVLHNNKWTSNNFVAIQVDGKGYDDIKDTTFTNEELHELAAAYSSKKIIEQNFGINVNDLYQKRSKDTWNKADILLVNKNNKIGYTKLKEIMKNLSEGDGDMSVEYNAALVGLTKDDILIPISLKEVPDASAKLYSHKIKDGGVTFEYFGDTAELQLPANSLKDDLKGSLYLAMTDNKTIDTQAKPNKQHCPLVQFYTRSDSIHNKNGIPTAKIELQGKHSKEGMGMLNICKELNISDTKSIYERDEQKIREGVKTFFGWKKLPDVVADSKTWYKKPCFTAIIGLLNIYCDVKQLDRSPEVLNDFTLFCIGCCLGYGAYYIIK